MATQPKTLPITTYTIQVCNKTNSTKSYALVRKCPKFVPREDGPAVTTISSIYLTANPAPGGYGAATFKAPQTLYAICGDLPPKYNSGMVLSTRDFEQVAITPKGTVSTVAVAAQDKTKKEFSFRTNDLDLSPGDGHFIINDTSAHTFDPVDYFVGLGAIDPNDVTKIIPVGAVPATSKTSWTITPTPVYYLLEGVFVPGEIVSPEQLKKAQVIDFSTENCDSVKLVQTSDGKFDRKWGPPLPPLIGWVEPSVEELPFTHAGSGPVRITTTLFWHPPLSLFSKAEASKTISKIKHLLNAEEGITDISAREPRLNNEDIQICTIYFSCESPKAVARLALLVKINENIIKKNGMLMMNMTISYEDDDGVLIAKRVEEGTREFDNLIPPPKKADPEKTVNIEPKGKGIEGDEKLDVGGVHNGL